MNMYPEVDRVFPLSGGSFERPPLRPPQLGLNLHITSGPVLGHRAFMRAWAARRAARHAAAAAAMPAAAPPEMVAASAS